MDNTLGFLAITCTIKSFRHIIGVYGPDLFILPPPTDPERTHAKVQLPKTTTHMTHTRNVPTIAHWRTPPRNAPTSRDLHDGISGKWQAQHWTQQSVHMLIEQKIVLKLPRTGENELLPGKEGHTMSVTLVQAAAGDLKRRQGSTGGVSEVRDFYVGMVWGVPDASERTCNARMTKS